LVKNESLRNYVAGRIRQLRQAYGNTGLSQDGLAKMIGVATNTISRWETAVYEPTLDDLEKLARALSVSILEFFPKETSNKEKGGKVEALMRAAEGLHAADLDELRSWAEYRRARQLYKSGKKRPRSS
jgi:transcriptional regulator with XRE-family HTH domain